MISHRREEGAVAVIVALLLVVFMAAVALTVDTGGLYLRRRALVNGSDAAALAAARTCARGVGHDTRFASPEEAADFEVQANAPITDAEVDPTINITYPPAGGCSAPTQYGHLSVRYTSEQALYFAPVLGFNHESPVTTTATASWGLGSNNPIPIVLTSAVSTGTCTIPPLAFPTTGQTCSFWYDNDRLGGGNFAFLSLNAAGWDVPDTSQCPASQSGGSSNLKNWINGSLPASVALNWTEPTYVCTETGIRGVQNGSLNCSNPNNPGNQSSVWESLECLAVLHAVRDFPINWEGPGEPIPGAPDQGTIYTGSPGNPTIDKYDIIGFASMKVIDVVTPQEAAGQTTTTQQPWDISNYSSNAAGITLTATLPSGSVVTYTWTGTRQQGGGTVNVGGTCMFTTNQDKLAGSYTWQAFGGNGNQCPGNGDVLDAGQPNPLGITYPVTTTAFGPCGPPPPGNSSAMCVILEYRHSTLDADFPPGTDNNTVIRLCDPGFDTCLDQ